MEVRREIAGQKRSVFGCDARPKVCLDLLVCVFHFLLRFFWTVGSKRCFQFLLSVKDRDVWDKARLANVRVVV